MLKIKDLKELNADEVEFIVIDEFCGFGGTGEGFDKSLAKAIVAAAINHDEKAITSHWLNHPDVEHFNEDITLMYGKVIHGILFKSPEMVRLMRMVDIYRAFYPNAKVILWASLECTNFSKAKGGQPRDADSRALADHMDRYIDALDPDYFKIENVVEFMSWGPLRIAAKKKHKANTSKGIYAHTELKMGISKKTGKEEYLWIPESKYSGKDFMRWCKHIKTFGYREEWRQLNSANYGAYTSRNRLFGCFAKDGLPIVWPESTHAKVPVNDGLFGTQLKWKAVKEVLNFNDEGESIFNRIKYCKNEKSARSLFSKQKKCKQIYISCEAQSFDPVCIEDNKVETFDKKVSELRGNGGKLRFYYYDDLVDASLERIEAGLIKFVAGGKTEHNAWLLKYNSSKNGVHNAPSVDEPCPTIACQNRLGIVNTHYLMKYYSGDAKNKVISVDGPAHTLKTKDGQALVNCEYFLAKTFSGRPEGKVIPVTGPAGTITTFGSHQLINCVPFIMNTNFKNIGSSIEDPAHTLTASRHHPYIVNPAFLAKYYGNGDNTSSIEEPAGTLVTKDRFSKIQPIFINRDYKTATNTSINEPMGALLTVPKANLVNCQPFILNPSHGGHCTGTDVPCVVIVARQDKAPLYLIQFAVDGNVSIPIYKNDSKVMIRIKKFMAYYGLSDIKMRMLMVSELLPIQGFPITYKMVGNQTDHKKMIGNSVVPLVVKCWAEALGNRLRELRRMAA